MPGNGHDLSVVDPWVAYVRDELRHVGPRAASSAGPLSIVVLADTPARLVAPKPAALVLGHSASDQSLVDLIPTRRLGCEDVELLT